MTRVDSVSDAATAGGTCPIVGSANLTFSCPILRSEGGVTFLPCASLTPYTVPTAESMALTIRDMHCSCGRANVP